MQYLIIGTIFILAIFAIRFSNKRGIPALLLFIVLGMVLVQLVLILRILSFLITLLLLHLWLLCFMVVLGLIGAWQNQLQKKRLYLVHWGCGHRFNYWCVLHYALGFDLLEGMLIGSIVGSTDYASVSNILRSKNLNLKYNTASLLELESGSNDPTAYTMTMVFLSVIVGTKVFIPVLILTQVVIGIATGFIFAYLVGKLIKILGLKQVDFIQSLWSLSYLLLILQLIF